MTFRAVAGQDAINHAPISLLRGVILPTGQVLAVEELDPAILRIPRRQTSWGGPAGQVPGSFFIGAVLPGPRQQVAVRGELELRTAGDVVPFLKEIEREGALDRVVLAAGDDAFLVLVLH